jgi:hypothetical protein
MPCSGPLDLPDFLSSSIALAMIIASGFISITELSIGPFLSIASIRSRYNLVICSELYLPEAIFSCNEVIFSSFSSKSGIVSADTPSTFTGLSVGLQEAANTELSPAVAMVLLAIKSLLFIIVSLGTKNTMYRSKQKINIDYVTKFSIS